ncbi:phage tail sheath family protein [Haliangium sp.]|uniref:phage tail sheath family protein n=1 Tax=Haliangium sp. TaxID=2663208 RepID=UPI003D102902
MSSQLLASKVVVIEEEPRVRSLPSIPTAVVGAVGVTERGPVGTPTLVTSFEEFSQIFGGHAPNADLPLAAQGFFTNGGSLLWVVRTVHYADIADAASKTSARAGLVLRDRAATPADTLAVEAKWDGTYAHRVRVIIAPATSGADGEFNLAVEEDGVVREVFANLSMDPTHARYVPGVVNDPRTGSSLVALSDAESQTLGPDSAPELGTFGPLTGGDDGLAGLTDADFIGSPVSQTGLRALDTVQDLSLLIVPGRATAAVHNAMIGYCEVVRGKGCFAIFDPPANADAAGVVTYVESTAALLGASEHAAMYWPRVRVLNPSRSVFGSAAEIVVPPSGHIAGVYARTDGSEPGGVYKPPAGIGRGQLLGVLGFETDEVLDEAKRDLVFPKRINPLTVFPGTPRHIDGARTLKGDGNFPTVAERRGVIFIEQSLKRGLLFAKHQNNTETLRSTVRRTIQAFLLTQMQNGAFRSQDPEQAFFVDVSDALNTPTVIFAGKLIARIGLATNKPAEFIVLKVSQDTRALEAELAGA